MASSGPGNVHVVIRVRPLANTEQANYRWRVNGNQICEVGQQNKPKPYIFDHVFDSTSTTEEVYNGVAVPILSAVMDGYNGTIFAYGQTSSGKTHTMMGSTKNEGVIPRIARSLFEYIEKTPTREFLLRVACIELYNEKIYDLFTKSRKPLNLREDAKSQPFVDDLSWEFVKSFSDLMAIMWKCEGNLWKQVLRGDGDEREEFTVTCDIQNGKKIIESSFANDVLDGSGEGAVRVSHLNLVDLAGSERTGQMGATGSRFKEGCAINTSLFVLGSVINKLTQADGQYINFRDSKLTRILQASLGGNAKTSIICTVTPDQIEETHSTLKFASMAKAMLNKPVVNEILSDEAVLKQYARQLQDLLNERKSLKEKERNQEQMEKELEESNRKNHELEAKILSLKERIIHSSNSSAMFLSQRSRRETWAGNLKFDCSNPVICPNLQFDQFAKWSDDVEPDQFQKKQKRTVRFDSIPDCFSEVSQYQEAECQTEFEAELKECECLNLKKKVKDLKLTRGMLRKALERKEEAAAAFVKEQRELLEFGNNELKVENEFLERSSKDAETMYLDSNKRISLLSSENQMLKEKLLELENTKLKVRDEEEMVESTVRQYKKELVLASGRIELLENELKDYDVQLQFRNERNEKLVCELKSQLQEAYDQMGAVGIDKCASYVNEKHAEEIRRRDETMKRLTNMVESKNKEIVGLETDVSVLNENNTDLKTTVANLETELKGYKETKTSLQLSDGKIVQLQNRIDFLHFSFETEANEELTNKIAVLESRNAERIESCSQTDEFWSDHDDLYANVSKLRSKNISLLDKVAGFAVRERDAREEIASLTSKNVELSTEVQKLNSAHEAMLESLREIEEGKEQWPLRIEQVVIDSLQSKEVLLLKATEAVNEMKLRFQFAKDCIQLSEEREAVLECRNAEAEEIADRLRLKIAELEERAGTGCNHETEMQIVHDEFVRCKNELKTENEDLQRRLDCEVKKLKDVQASAVANNVQCTLLVETSTRLNNEIAVLERRLIDLEEENVQLKEYLENADEKCKKFQGYCDEYHEEYEENKAKIEDLQQKVAEAATIENETQIKKLKEENERFRNEIGAYVKQGYRTSSQLSDERKKLQLKVESLEEQVETQQQRISFLKKDLRRLQLQNMNTTNLVEPDEMQPKQCSTVPMKRQILRSNTEHAASSSSAFAAAAATGGSDRQPTAVRSKCGGGPPVWPNFTMDVSNEGNIELEHDLKSSNPCYNIQQPDHKRLDSKMTQFLGQIETTIKKENVVDRMKIKKENLVDNTKENIMGDTKKVRSSQRPILMPLRRTDSSGKFLFIEDEVSLAYNEECKVS